MSNLVRFDGRLYDTILPGAGAARRGGLERVMAAYWADDLGGLFRWLKGENIQHPTSNIEHPMAACCCVNGCWAFDVCCWMFRAGDWLHALLALVLALVDALEDGEAGLLGIRD